MPLPLPPSRRRLAQGPVQVRLPLLLPAHLPKRLGRLDTAVSGLPGRRWPRALAGEALRALEFRLVDLIGGLLLRKRVLLEVRIPRGFPLVVGARLQLLVARSKERVSLQRLTEVGTVLLLRGGLGLGLLQFGGLLVPLRESLLQLGHLVVQVGRSHAILRRVPDVARDVFDLVAEEALQRGLCAPVILGLVLLAADHDRAIGFGSGIVDALLFDPVALEFLALIFELFDLARE